jgi:hypothetical protein
MATIELGAPTVGAYRVRGDGAPVPVDVVAAYRQGAPVVLRSDLR